MNQRKPCLYLGNHNYSSWSLRPWLCLRWAGIDFDEVQISLLQEGYGGAGIAEVAAVSPNRKVPALHLDGLVIWDSLAIAEWAAETMPDAGLWPEDPETRALARSAVCEMHSGFPDLRNDLPMNINRRSQVDTWTVDTRRDIDRIIELWLGLRARHASGGPWLFGSRCIADAFYAPVVTRFRSYGVSVPDELEPFTSAILHDADFREWENRPVTDRFGFIDDLYR